MGQATSSDETDDPKRLYINVEKNKWPIVYSSNYDISFYKMESLHPFDSSKWRRVFQFLQEQGLFKGEEDTVQPLEASPRDLLVVHTQEYLDSLTVSTRLVTVFISLIAASVIKEGYKLCWTTSLYITVHIQ